jgi:hypothetical protein
VTQAVLVKVKITGVESIDSNVGRYFNTDDGDDDEGVVGLMSSPVHQRRPTGGHLEEEVNKVRATLAGHVIHRTQASKDFEGNVLVDLPELVEVTLKADLADGEKKYHEAHGGRDSSMDAGLTDGIVSMGLPVHEHSGLMSIPSHRSGGRVRMMYVNWR